jgi:hypothetical protein
LARYDKYDPISGGFRAKLAADLAATEDTGTGVPVGVSLNASGQVQVGGGTDGTNYGDPLIGVLCTTKNLKAGDVVDVMTEGEIVEMPSATFVAGSTVFAVGTTGALDITAPAAVGTKTRVGYIVEVGRLVVRVTTVTHGGT